MKTKWLLAAMAIAWTLCGFALWIHWQDREQIQPDSAVMKMKKIHTPSAGKKDNHTDENGAEAGKVQTATIGMIGDVLLHHPIYTYPDFDFAFAAVKDKLEGIDFLLANQESMPGGTELGLSTYPIFNSPKHIIGDLKNAGVDMISLANNHTLDKGEAGVLKSIEHAKEYGMPYVGAYNSFEDRAKQRIIEVNGIRFGVLAYTYGTNIGPAPAGKKYLVNLIDYERIAEDIQRIKPDVDVTVVSLHWGPEYHLQHSEAQEKLAQHVSAAGADIIFGHHPHVLQPYAEVGSTKVFYSLGNFYSAQPYEYTNFGGIARLTVTKETIGGAKAVSVDDPRLFPTAVIRDAQNRFKVVPLEQAGQMIKHSDQWVENHVGVPKW